MISKSEKGRILSYASSLNQRRIEQLDPGKFEITNNSPLARNMKTKTETRKQK